MDLKLTAMTRGTIFGWHRHALRASTYGIVAQQQVVPAQLLKYPVVINPSMPAMVLMLTNQKPGIC
jgi:hypothetical protein